MALSGVLKPIDWFITTAPKPLRFVIFLFIMIVFGVLINNVIVGNNYYCYDGKLIDNKEFSKCYLNYINAYIWKYNLTQEECYNLPEASDPAWNNTVCEELIPTITRATWITYIATSIQSGFTRFTNFLMGINSSSSFMTRLYNPGKAMCGELYDCLSYDTRTNLGLTPNCEFKKGYNVDDDFPSIENFTYWTRVNKTINIDDIDELKLFQVSCFDTGEEEIPELMFLGIPLFDWRLWVLFMIIGSFIYLVILFGRE